MRRPLSHTQMLETARAEARLARKKRYRNVIGLGLGGAGIAAALAGLPTSVSVIFWGLGLAAWALLKAV
ncbi:MAG: hypothetical protein AB7L65_07260 [Hyphomonadaceae bacterium]